ncbi:MAG: DUF5803 family protein [Halobacteriaceae archaeon]
MSRRALAALALVSLALLAGCGSGGVDRSALNESADYDFDRDATVTYDITKGDHAAIVDVTAANRTTFELYWHAELGGRQPLSIEALQFRYPNGTVVGAGAFTVERSGSKTVIEAPAGNGTMAFTASVGDQHLDRPVIAEGSHEVILPRGMRVAAPVFGDVSPGGYTTEMENGRVHVRWNETPSGSLSVDYYLERDFWLFTGLVGLLTVVGLVGVAYFRHQIRLLERQREAADHFEE